VIRADPDRKGEVLFGGEHGDEVEELEDEAKLVAAELGEPLIVELGDLGPVDPGLAGCRAVEACEHVHEGGLARARGADNRRQLPPREVERHPTNRLDSCFALAKATT
jgi:hypothetical protein